MSRRRIMGGGGHDMNSERLAEEVEGREQERAALARSMVVADPSSVPSQYRDLVAGEQLRITSYCRIHNGGE